MPYDPNRRKMDYWTPGWIFVYALWASLLWDIQKDINSYPPEQRAARARVIKRQVITGLVGFVVACAIFGFGTLAISNLRSTGNLTGYIDPNAEVAESCANGSEWFLCDDAQAEEWCADEMAYISKGGDKGWSYDFCRDR